ncbi:phosphoglucosamine mutase [Theileria orientalis strain Shintoku]|uniref:Phosphoglucosamine mutase n=1 Tax=Theileria orientalis strain Shintoku TaxID=869250 RepID=J4CD84_THEOR|nr:phosphoglucosamine mutase [Theileria orientalis strain Shintoku]BAM40697.1 phosphoglucosamine mutase [Theileria orientalis strain Shintoku]|eukprot:XP_009690998.1 phosphoglucosamine mutase [Theileria orientalis strain Shintoku]
MLDFSVVPDGPSIPPGYIDLSYGTSGFRANALFPQNNLEHVAYRCGLLFASLPFFSDEYFEKYSKFLGSDRRFGLGVVVTASHNPCCDNGIKLFSPSGHMLESSWEPYFTSFVNSRRNVRDALCEIYGRFTYRPRDLNLSVLIGWDTRTSSESLVANLRLGIESVFKLLDLGASEVRLVGTVTSPCISYLLSSNNLDVEDDHQYLRFLNDSVMNVVLKFQALGLLDVGPTAKREELLFDCAYGVGGPKVMKAFGVFRHLGLLPAVCNLHRFGTEYDLNNKCGASYVFNTGYLPESLKPDLQKYLAKRFCSFDGDADRIIYYMPADAELNADNEYGVLVLNGDRLIVVTLMLLWTLLRTWRKRLRIGVLLTRYSNGSTVSFIRGLFQRWHSENSSILWELEFFNSGIKNAERLSEKYYVSVYYETNGHGNVVFNPLFAQDPCDRISCSDQFPSRLYSQSLADLRRRLDPSDPSFDVGFRDRFSESLLFEFLSMFFPGGDAILNSLVLELAFKTLKLTFRDCLGLYSYLPFSLSKYDIPVTFRELFVSSPEDETILVEPEGFQDKINSVTGQFSCCRAFLRPSGTEPLLRVYVEAENQADVDHVHAFIIKLVEDFLSTKRL